MLVAQQDNGDDEEVVTYLTATDYKSILQDGTKFKWFETDFSFNFSTECFLPSRLGL